MDNKIVNYKNIDSFSRNRNQVAKNSKNEKFYANNARLLYSLAKLDSLDSFKKQNA